MTSPAQHPSPIDLATVYPLEQEWAVALPLGYQPDAPEPTPRIGVMLHAFHIGLMGEFRAYLDQLPFPADLFVSTDRPEKRDALEHLFSDWDGGQVTVTVTPNRGRDIGPKLVGHGAAHAGYDLVLHLHTKHSAHESGLAGWRGYLLETLLGTPDTVRGIVEAFRQAPRLGMLAPQHIEMLRPWIRWGENYDLAAALAGRMGFPLPRRAPLDFPAGSMFWARPAALRPLLDLGLRFEDFQDETGQTDGTLAHALERLYFHACEAAGYQWMKIARRGLLHEESGLLPVRSAPDLRRVISRSALSLRALRKTQRALTDEAVIPFPLPRPRRGAFLPWRRLMGEDGAVPAGRCTILSWHDGARDEQTARSAEAAIMGAPPGVGGAVRHLGRQSDNGGRTDLAAALAEGFEDGADLMLLLRQPGLLHPRAVSALLHMSARHGGRALLEPSLVPGTTPQAAAAESLALAVANGAALAIPRAVVEAVRAVDETLDEEAAFQDFVSRAVAAGFPLLLCPLALFSPDLGQTA